MKFITNIINSYKQAKTIKEEIKDTEEVIVKNANDLERLFLDVEKKVTFNKNYAETITQELHKKNEQTTLDALKSELNIIDTENETIIEIIKKSILVSDSTLNYNNPELLYSKNTNNHIQRTQQTGRKLSVLLTTAEEVKIKIEQNT